MAGEVSKKSNKEMKTIFKEKEVLIGDDTIVVRQWSAYKFVKIVPRLKKVLDKIVGKSIDMADGDPQEIFDQLENLVINHVVGNLAEVFAVSSEEVYGIIKETIEKDDEWMSTIPYDKMFILGSAIVEVCLTKEVIKNVRSLLDMVFKKVGKKVDKSLSEK